MSDPLERLDRARQQLELLRSYGNDGGLRGDQARGDIAAAEAEIVASTEPLDPPHLPGRAGSTPKRVRGK